MSHSDISFYKTMGMIIGALVAFLIIIIIVANSLSTGQRVDKKTDPMVRAAVEARIKPFGQVNTGDVTAATAAPAAAVDGQSIYTSACFACHGTGAAGAPKRGDQGAWRPRIAQGMDTLVEHALNGFNAMPPKGGRADLSDEAVIAAIKYMVDGSQ